MTTKAEIYCVELQLEGQFAAIRARECLKHGALRLATAAQNEACAYYQRAQELLTGLCAP